jgi:hypothetical protein
MVKPKPWTGLKEANKLSETELSKYKKYVSSRLGELSPLLQKYAVGDFDQKIVIPEKEDEFTELLVGLSLMVDDIKELIKDQAVAAAKAAVAEAELKHLGEVRALNTRLTATIKELKEANEDLSKFHEVAVDRELEMIELKNEINALLEKLGQAQKYETPEKIRGEI